MKRTEGRHYGPQTDTRAAILALLRGSDRPLSTIAIMRHTDRSRTAVHYHLAALEADVIIARLDGRAAYWFYRASEDTPPTSLSEQ